MKYFLLFIALMLCDKVVSAQRLKPVFVIKKNTITDRHLVTQKKSLQKQSIVTNTVSAASVNGCACVAGPVLPVTLLEFKGKRLNLNTVLLNWKTTNEILNQGFDIQRSLGETNQFYKVAFTPSKGGNGADNAYTLNDNNSFAGTSYYRLKQIDVDGNFTFSNTVAVQGYNTKGSIQINPNPATNFINVNINYPVSESSSLVLYDGCMRINLQKQLALFAGSNNITISVNQLASGFYFIKVIDKKGNNELVGRFFKQ